MMARKRHARTFIFRLLPEEWAAVQEAAARDHRLPGAWIRLAALEAVGQALDDDGTRATRNDRPVGDAPTQEERAAFQAEAARLGLSLAAWMRLAALRRLRGRNKVLHATKKAVVSTGRRT